MFVNKNLSLSAIVLSVYVISACSAYRILGVFPMPGPSHYFLGGTLLKKLAETGHDVTIISPFKDQNPPKNGTWREIFLEKHVTYMDELKQRMTNQVGSENFMSMIFLMNSMLSNLTELTLRNQGVQELINSGEKFDAVIVTEFMADALKALSYKFDAHLIIFSNHGGLNWFFEHIGNIIPPSVFPELMTSFPPKMNFFQRLQNSAVSLFMKVSRNMLSYPTHNKLVKKYFPGSPELSDILRNVSLVLVNSHISLNTPQPKVPVMIEIAGFHVNPPKKLPKDLQKLLDEAKNGVIYFSLGSNFKSEDLSPDKIDAILIAFSKRNETILWKWGQDEMPAKPKNVYLGKWFPQQDILAHPNVKLFVTHSGFLSTTETVYHGVPVVSLPLLGDQKMNAISASQSGFGQYIFMEDISEQKLSKALEEVISNPKYRETVKEKSRIFHDRPSPPIQDAIYWVEYVIRHNGAKHLRVPYLDLKWYQYYLLDVIAFSFIVIAVVVHILKNLVRFLFKLLFGAKSKIKQS